MADPSLGQADIDKILASMDASDPPSEAMIPATEDSAATPNPAAPVAAPPAPVAPTTNTPPAAQVAAKPVPKKTKGTAQDDIDLNEIEELMARGTEIASGTISTSSSAAVSGSSSGQLDQSEIDKLLADLNPASIKASAVNPEASPTQSHLSQGDIDKLLNDLEEGSHSGKKKPDVAPITGAVKRTQGGTELTQFTKSTKKPAASTTATAAPPVTGSVSKVAKDKTAVTNKNATKDSALSQEDIDKMLADLGGGNPASPDATAEAPPDQTLASATATQSLSPDEIKDIISKQEGTASTPEGEAEIAQSDIDALVKQLAQATGAPPDEQVADAIADKSMDIDRIQAEAHAVPGPEMTRDAVDVNSVLGRTASTASLNTYHTQPAVATVATVEWRAARYLLVAAVLLLGICSGALVILTASVHGLSDELQKGRAVEHPTVERYADRMRLALAKLTEVDESERARGVRWLMDIKREHPDHAADVGIALARYYRSEKAWKRASDEYAAAEEAAIVDDPRILLEHTDCLARQGKTAEAIRQIYTLLSTEGRWLAEHDSGGRPTQELERNRQAVADAYLHLGRLLVRLRESNNSAVAVKSAEVAQPTSEIPPVEPRHPTGGGH